MGKQPNLLFILADQFRAMCVEPGGDPVATPTLDTLMADGTYLPHAVSNYPVCSPHRAMMMSGQYPDQNGVSINVNSKTAIEGVGLKADAPSWAAVLQDSGYNTGYIGKWHLQAPVPEDAIHGTGPMKDGTYWDAYSPVDRRFGFDFWYSYGCSDQHLTPHYWTGDAARHERIDIKGWSATHETDIALDFIAKAVGPANEGKPFALAVSYNPPHQPFNQLPEGYDTSYSTLAPEELLNRANVDFSTEAGARATEIAPLYYAAVTAIDAQVGRLVEALDRLNLADDTLVIFTSDHGQQMGSHDMLYKNVPFEESMRIPFVLRWPGRIRQDCSNMGISSVDIAPTLLGMLGFGGKVPASMQGRDISAALRTGPSGETPDAHTGLATPSALYFHYPFGNNPQHARGLRTATTKFIAEFTEETGLATYLYDLLADPQELTNINDPEQIRIHAVTLLDTLAEAGESWPGNMALAALAGAVVL